MKQATTNKESNMNEEAQDAAAAYTVRHSYEEDETLTSTQTFEEYVSSSIDAYADMGRMQIEDAECYALFLRTKRHIGKDPQ